MNDVTAALWSLSWEFQSDLQSLWIRGRNKIMNMFLEIMLEFLFQQYSYFICLYQCGNSVLDARWAVWTTITNSYWSSMLQLLNLINIVLIICVHPDLTEIQWIRHVWYKWETTESQEDYLAEHRQDINSMRFMGNKQIGHRLIKYIFGTIWYIGMLIQYNVVLKKFLSKISYNQNISS